MGDTNKLLIVDDSEEILLTLEQFFSRQGYEVVTAPDGLEAKKIFENDPEAFDCIITDLVMPMISGPGLIAIVRKGFPEIPIVAITGYGEQPERLAVEAAANVILEKPIRLNELESIVEEVIKKHRKRNK